MRKTLFSAKLLGLAENKKGTPMRFSFVRFSPVNTSGRIVILVFFTVCIKSKKILID